MLREKTLSESKEKGRGMLKIIGNILFFRSVLPLLKLVTLNCFRKSKTIENGIRKALICGQEQNLQFWPESRHTRGKKNRQKRYPTVSDGCLRQKSSSVSEEKCEKKYYTQEELPVEAPQDSKNQEETGNQK